MLVGGGSTNVLSKFSVAGDGEVAWKKIIFTVASSSNVVALTGIKLYDSSNVEIPGSATMAGTKISFVANSEELVSGSKTYQLKASVVGTVSTNDYVSTNIQTVSGVETPNTYSDKSDGTETFVWSDQSANGHSEGTGDWNNDYLVKNLSTDTQTLTK